MSIEKSKSFIDANAGFGSAIEAAFADGKISLEDGFSLLPSLMKEVTAFKDIKPVFAEFKAATNEERDELLKYAREKFNFQNKKLEAKVEAGLGMLIYAGELFAPDEEVATPVQ